MENVLSAKNLTKRYGSTLALDGLDLELPQGKIVGDTSKPTYCS